MSAALGGRRADRGQAGLRHHRPRRRACTRRSGRRRARTPGGRGRSGSGPWTTGRGGTGHRRRPAGPGARLVQGGEPRLAVVIVAFAVLAVEKVADQRGSPLAALERDAPWKNPSSSANRSCRYITATPPSTPCLACRATARATRAAAGTPARRACPRCSRRPRRPPRGRRSAPPPSRSTAARACRRRIRPRSWPWRDRRSRAPRRPRAARSPAPGTRRPSAVRSGCGISSIAAAKPSIENDTPRNAASGTQRTTLFEIRRGGCMTSPSTATTNGSERKTLRSPSVRRSLPCRRNNCSNLR